MPWSSSAYSIRAGRTTRREACRRTAATLVRILPPAASWWPDRGPPRRRLTPPPSPELPCGDGQRPVGEAVEEGVGEVVDEEVDHVTLALDAAGGDGKRREQQGVAEAAGDVRAEDQIGEAGLVLEGHEHHAPGGRGPLADDGKTRDAGAGAVRQVVEITRPQDAAAGEIVAQKRTAKFIPRYQRARARPRGLWAIPGVMPRASNRARSSHAS